MNLKEEIQKHRRTFDGNGMSLHLIDENDALQIAESYAKEKAIAFKLFCAMPGMRNDPKVISSVKEAYKWFEKYLEEHK